MLEFSNLTQDFVEATSALVGGRTINIMDRNAIIIASTEKDRIGSFHQGAAEVIATGRPVLIERKALSQYPGAKEGYNMPIFLKDELIGVVGIFGCPSEVKDVANLLRVYVTQQFSLQSMAQRQNVETEVRSQLLRLLLLGDTGQLEAISQLSVLLSLQLAYPVRVIILRAPEGESPQEHLIRFSQMFQNLLWQGALDRRHDVFGIQENDYVIIRSQGGEASKEQSAIQKIAETASHEKGCRVAVSSICSRLEAIPGGMKEANALLAVSNEPFCCIDDTEFRIRYLMYKSLIHGGEPQAQELYHRLCSSQDEQQARILLTTAHIYYQVNGSVQKASQRLHIHKNTLLYRMKLLYSLLGLEGETPFSREFFIRLILLYHPAEQV